MVLLAFGNIPKRSEKVGKGEAGVGHSVLVSPAFMIVLDIRILPDHWDRVLILWF